MSAKYARTIASVSPIDAAATYFAAFTFGVAVVLIAKERSSGTVVVICPYAVCSGTAKAVEAVSTARMTEDIISQLS
ncbi:MAG: hypothetical protein RLZZ70_391 [Candidatus Parcubacteria bacterium]|jgi:hypothetical protein